MIQHFLMSANGGGSTPAPIKDPKNYIFAGDSITHGFNVAIGDDYPYITFENYGRTTDLYSNIGVSGWTATQIYADIDTATDLFSINRNNVVILLAGINDIGEGLTTVSEIYTVLKNYWAAIKAAGGVMVACTLLPAGDNQTWEDEKNALNVLIKSDPSLYDYRIDFDENNLIGYDGAQDDTGYYQDDKVHPWRAGNVVMADVAGSKLITI